MTIHYTLGLPEDQRTQAARLYDEAFGPKLSRAVSDQGRREALLAASLVNEYAFCALLEGQLVGLAGFQTADGSLTGGITYRALLEHLGLVRGNWAALIFSLYERRPLPGRLLMDGIAVREGLRGRGIGTRLLQQLSDYAAQQGYESIRLDVIDINPGARRLYERYGFEAIKTERFEYLRWLIGFGGATTMELKLGAKPAQVSGGNEPSSHGPDT
jgi:ribosomal protein S18 acetylase RimI-like enzyme